MKRSDVNRQRILEALVKSGGEGSAESIGAALGRTSAQVSSLCRGLQGRSLVVVIVNSGRPRIYALTEKGQTQGLRGLRTRSKVRAWICKCGAQVWCEYQPSRCPSCGASRKSDSSQPWARPILLEGSQ